MKSVASTASNTQRTLFAQCGATTARADRLSAVRQFEEYFVLYPVKSTPRSSHDLARHAVGTGQKVLDIGCGDGNFSALLEKAGNAVTGIDRREPTEATALLDDYRQTDIDHARPVLPADLPRESFDCVLLLDILQTLRHPEDLLRECARRFCAVQED